jgi:acyl carrier protein
LGIQDKRRQDLEKQILDLVIQDTKLDPSRITPDATLESLEVHSIDIVMLMMSIEDKFGVYIPIDGNIAEVKDVRGFVQSIADHILREQ